MLQQVFLLFEAIVLGATLHAVADKVSGAGPRDASDRTKFNEQIKKVSWQDKASGARPRDACD